MESEKKTAEANRKVWVHDIKLTIQLHVECVKLTQIIIHFLLVCNLASVKPANGRVCQMKF